MTEKEKMLSQKLYNANYDVDILNDRTQCKIKCQAYNQLPIDDIEARQKAIQELFPKTGEQFISNHTFGVIMAIILTWENVFMPITT